LATSKVEFRLLTLRRAGIKPRDFVAIDTFYAASCAAAFLLARAAFFAASLAFAALAALAFFRLAASLALAAADNFLLAFGAGAAVVPDPPLSFAHLAFCASAIRLRAAALSPLRLLVRPSDATVSADAPGSIARSSAICESIRTFCCSNPAIAAVMISGVSLDIGIVLSRSYLHTGIGMAALPKKNAM
jgi:hypothetical protein